MNVRSLALTTELALAGTRGTIIDRGNYLVLRTPDDPGYYSGNVLVLPSAPHSGELAVWMRRFAAELGIDPAIKHVTLWWNGITGDTAAASELVAAGFTLTTNLAMIGDEVVGPPTNLEIRPLRVDEVGATGAVAWAIAERHDESYRRFLERRVA